MSVFGFQHRCVSSFPSSLKPFTWEIRFWVIRGFLGRPVGIAALLCVCQHHQLWPWFSFIQPCPSDSLCLLPSLPRTFWPQNAPSNKLLPLYRFSTSRDGNSRAFSWHLLFCKWGSPIQGRQQVGHLQSICCQTLTVPSSCWGGYANGDNCSWIHWVKSASFFFMGNEFWLQGCRKYLDMLKISFKKK